ncbi:hypothetical protein FDX11_00245 [Citrobacter sp. wls714]|nr:hypothetical protein FDX11_00245 [Citrobacter sp. wls714]
MHELSNFVLRVARALQLAQQGPFPEEYRKTGKATWFSMLEATRSIRHCQAGDCSSLHPVSTGYAQGVNFRHKKTTRRWFHDTAYCFDYSLLSHGTRSGT